MAILRGFGQWKRACAARLTSSERGQALVEFAVTSPMLIFLLFGTVEVGHATNAYLQVLTAARDAARLGVRGGTDSELQSIVTVETANLPNTIPTSCNVGAPGMCITRATTPGPSSVKMQVCYNHPLIVGIPAVLPNPWLMCSATVMRRLS
ncbi:MAG: TadE/TadG family type IV pilus assembly protein [Dehalococcoidia bacterium]